MSRGKFHSRLLALKILCRPPAENVVFAKLLMYFSEGLYVAKIGRKIGRIHSIIYISTLLQYTYVTHRSAERSAENMLPPPNDISEMEPMLPEESSRALDDISFDLIAKAH